MPFSQNRLVIVDPGHFHAALLQQQHLPDVSPRVAVYAPLSSDLLDYMERIARFNSRAVQPTAWELEIHASPDFLTRMLQDQPGNIAVFAGRNRGKIARIQAALKGGMHVLADKPWIIRSADLPLLAEVLNHAAQNGLAASDMMTERYEITSILQRALVNDPAVFGALTTGSPGSPAITARSVHHLMKQVAGASIRRPAWFFDIGEYGEALADVGTHVVDLVQWTAFPGEILDYSADVRIEDASRWPTNLTAAQFREVTGVEAFPPALHPWVHDNELHYYANNFIRYSVKGIHIALEILWSWQAPDGEGDLYESAFCGSRCRIEIRRGTREKNSPELYVVPAPGESYQTLRRPLEDCLSPWPGVLVEDTAAGIYVSIPATFREGHEAHFSQVSRQFLTYCRAPEMRLKWERANMLLKYFITTGGVEMASRP